MGWLIDTPLEALARETIDHTFTMTYETSDEKELELEIFVLFTVDAAKAKEKIGDLSRWKTCGPLDNSKYRRRLRRIVRSKLIQHLKLEQGEYREELVWNPDFFDGVCSRAETQLNQKGLYIQNIELLSTERTETQVEQEEWEEVEELLRESTELAVFREGKRTVSELLEILKSWVEEA